jgi:Protein of unknown function (DUF3102)
MSEVIDRHTFRAMLKEAGGNLEKVSLPHDQHSSADERSSADAIWTNRRSVDEWAEVIRADLRRSVESVIAAGRHLREAKEQVDHGEWTPLLDRIGISGGTARKLMAIAADPVISDRSHVNVLPPSWGTLYALSLVPDDILKKKIADGTITPEMERKEAEALVPPHDPWEEWQGMPAFKMEPTKPC